jgi:DNA topoisomerase-1
MVKQVYKKRFYKKATYCEIPQSANTATYLIIVESPSKCKKIEEYLGSQYTCISSKGHIRSIKNGLKSIDVKNNYTVEYEILEEKREHVEWMKKIIPMFSKKNIILATDDDREGEAIAWHICMVFDFPIETTKRIIFREITQSAIKESLDKPTIINMNIVNAQMCRQVLDLLVGFKISPILWKHLYRNKENSLSAGRCQTPALKLVYDNEIEAKQATINTTYKITGSFFPKKIIFDLSKEFENEAQVLDFLEHSKLFNHSLSIGQKKESIKIPPKPFNTSGLLQKASSVLGIGPKETMSICQQLYQDGFITYMRTESQKYSDVFLKRAQEYIVNRFGKEEYIGKFEDIVNNDSKNPHEAIRVTNIEMPSIETENSRTLTLYKLIWRNTVESCMSEAKYNNTSIIITAPKDLTYKYIVEVPIFLGFTKLIEESRTNTIDDQNIGAALLLYIQSSPKENIRYNNITSTLSIHGKHSHYTEASLIKKLEDLGIGRPSTFAMIIDTIIERGYVKKTDIEGITIKANEFTLEKNIIQTEEKERTFGNEKGKLVIQPIGSVVTDFLYRYFGSLFSYDYTTKMEAILDEISIDVESTSEPWYKTCETCNLEIMQLIKPIEKLGKQAFSIRGSEYKLVFEKYGPVLRIAVNDTFEYKKIKPDIKIDLDKLQKGEYCQEELIEDKKEQIIGELDGVPIILKSGPYGEYIEYSDKKESIKSLGECKTSNEIVEAFKNKISSQTIDNKMIRILTNELSIRNGKFGAYIHYKTEKMTKPKFLNIQKFKESYRNCSEEILMKWIKDTYNI